MFGLLNIAAPQSHKKGEQNLAPKQILIEKLVTPYRLVAQAELGRGYRVE